MTAPQANLLELRDQLTGCRVSYDRNPDRSITIRNLTRGTTVTLSGIKVVERGNHVQLLDHYGNWLILPHDPRLVRKHAKSALAASVSGLLVSLIAGVLVNYGVSLFEPTRPQIDERLKELSVVKDSLQKVSAYVYEQESELRTLDASLSERKKEKENLETILATDKKQVDALLAQVTRTSTRDKWIERIVSFLIGVFSSLTATYMWTFVRSGRRDAQQSGGAYFEPAAGPKSAHP